MESKYKKCPDCGSNRITKFVTVDFLFGVNVSSGKIIYRDEKPTKSQPTYISYKCRKCGWVDDGETIGT